jgi:hypothetical protein
MSLLQSRENYTAPVKDPETGATVTVTLRRLNAADKARLDDTLRMEFESEDEITAELKLGTWRMLTVKAAVVSWDSPGDPPPTPEVIEALHPDVFEQIHAAIEAKGDATAPEEEPAAPAENAGEGPTAPLRAVETPEPQPA